ncbi:hypothetical protein MHYP_G00000810 [Metynnis hypsauchen]
MKVIAFVCGPPECVINISEDDETRLMVISVITGHYVVSTVIVEVNLLHGCNLGMREVGGRVLWGLRAMRAAADGRLLQGIGSIKANGGSLKRESCLAWAGHGGPTPGQTLQRNSSVIGLCEAGQAPTLLLSSPTKGERMN